MKAAKGIVRVSGTPSNKDKVFEVCESIVAHLDAGNWSSLDGRKNVFVK